jgi:type I restriction enzyme S subunit
VLIREDADYVFASFLIGTRPKKGSELSDDYFYRWLSSEQVQAYLSASSEGTTGLNNLSHSFFRAMSIPFPGAAEQTTIVRILSAVDTAIESTHAALDRACELRKSLINKLLSHGTRTEPQQKSPAGLIPASWSSETLGQNLEEGPTNGVYRPESDYAVFGTPIVRIDDFEDGRIKRDTTLRRVLIEPLTQRRYALAEKDVVINRVNSLSHIGKSMLVPPLEEPTIFESNMIRVRCGPRLLPAFLNIVLCADTAKRHWLSRAKPAVNQASINQRDVRELMLPLPRTSGEQQEIVAAVSAVERRLDVFVDVVAAQEQLKRSLVNDLLTGQVRALGNAQVAA